VLAAAHGAIGLRVVVSEWTGLRGISLEVFMLAAGLLLAALGLRAVYAVTA
jgi:fumarate reductase subunit C